MGYRDDFFEENDSNYGWYTCVRCGKKLRKGDVDVDHILPQKHGGGNGTHNLQCLCVHCNRSKGADLGDTAQDYVKNNVSRAGSKINKWFK